MSDKVWKFSEKDINLSEFARNEDFSDVTIRVGDENIPCHRIILVNRIPFFRTLFAASSWKKSAESEVFELEVVTTEAFHEILKYAYSAEFEVSEQNVPELLRASCYLQVEKVITKCVEFVNSTNLGEQAVLDAFSIAFQHNLKSVKDRTRNYILSEISAVSNNVRFNDLTYYHLKFLFADADLANVKTEYFLDAILKWIEKDADGLKMKCVPSLLALLNFSMYAIHSLSEKNEKYKKLLGDHNSNLTTSNLIPEKRCAIKPTFYLTIFRYDDFNNLIVEFHFGIFRQDDIVLTGEKRIIPALARFDGVPEPNHLCYLDDNIFCVTQVNPTVIEQYAERVTKFSFRNYATVATYVSNTKPDCVFFVQYRTYGGTINYEEAILRYYNIRTNEWWVTRILPSVAKNFLFPFLVKYDDLFILTESDAIDPRGRIAINGIPKHAWYNPQPARDSACYANGRLYLIGGYMLSSYDIETASWQFEGLRDFPFMKRPNIIRATNGNHMYSFGTADSVGPCFVFRFIRSSVAAEYHTNHTALDSIPLSVCDARIIPFFSRNT